MTALVATRRPTYTLSPRLEEVRAASARLAGRRSHATGALVLTVNPPRPQARKHF